MIKDIKKLKHLTTWQLLDYLVFRELSEEIPLYSISEPKKIVCVYNEYEEKKKRTRSYECNVFTEFGVNKYTKPENKINKEDCDKLRYKIDELEKLIKDKDLPIYAITKENSEYDLISYVLGSQGRIDVKWERSIAEVVLSSNNGDSISIRSFPIYFKTKDILQVLEGKKRDYNISDKGKRVRELARVFFNEGITNKAKLINNIQEALANEFSKGLSTKQIWNDIKSLNLKLDINKVGRPKNA